MSMQGARVNFSARLQAAQTLYAVFNEDAYASLKISETLRSHADAPEVEKRFYVTLVYSLLEHLEVIDAVIDAHVHTPLSHIEPYVLSVLRVALAQLMYLTKVPPHSAINEAVETVKTSKYRSLSSFTNAVLRSCQRDGFRYEKADSGKNLIRFLSLKYNMPREIAAYFSHYARSLTRQHFPLKAEDILSRFAHHEDTCLRINPLLTNPDEVLHEAQQYFHLDSSQMTFRPETKCLYLSQAMHLSQFPLYQEGKVSVQDESSVLAAMAVEAQSGETVWDMCAAPGSKSMVLAQQMRNRGTLLATDLHESRIQLIKQNAEREHLTIIQTKALDASHPKQADLSYSFTECFDRILLDAPCSGLGLLGSKPDLKYHQPLQKVQELVCVQEDLLESAYRALKKGGRLVYSTCTMTADENENQIGHFIEAHPDMELLDLAKILPNEVLDDTINRMTLLLLPKEHGRDGFFIAAMQKKE